MKVIIDRFEGEYAIVELSEGIFEKMPKTLLPNGKENDVVSIAIDQEETNRRKTIVNDLMNHVFEDEW